MLSGPDMDFWKVHAPSRASYTIQVRTGDTSFSSRTIVYYITVHNTVHKVRNCELILLPIALIHKLES